MPVNPRNKEGVIKVDIYKPVYGKISKLAERQKITIKDYINRLLETHVSTLELLSKRFSEISQVGATDNAILMQDKGKNNVIASITLQKEDGNMFCSVCKKTFCEHIFRSLLSPDWIKILENLDTQK
jgi:hypothetical protein